MFLYLKPLKVIYDCGRAYSCMLSKVSAQRCQSFPSLFCLGIVVPPNIDASREITSNKENRSDDNKANTIDGIIDTLGKSRGKVPMGATALDSAASISIFTNLTLLQRIC